MAKIYRVIQIKLNQLVEEISVWLTNKAYLSAVTLTNISQEFLPTRRHQNSTCIDMEQITPLSPYVWLTLSIVGHMTCSVGSRPIGKQRLQTSSRKLFTNFSGRGGAMLYCCSTLSSYTMAANCAPGTTSDIYDYLVCGVEYASKKRTLYCVKG